MRRSKKDIVKWIIYALLLLVFYILQTTPGLFQIYGAKPVLIVPLAICIAIFEGELGGAVIGLITGLLWDLSSNKLSGYNAIIIMAACIVTALLIMYLMRANWVNATILCGCTMAIHGLLDFLFYYAMWGYEGVWIVLTNRLAPMVVYTAVVTPPIFFLVRKIASKYNEVLRV
ncbi:MAG: rod shape-determining protein MreD [Oscillospiraceae bacterium]|jgi:rod shape-determining protein MreD|nr:rod shape-determining protein MreD [Oscillospiraceae bacterium]